MAILTLTTDWGYRDPYLAAFKGELLGACPDVTLIDLSHEVERFNVLEASFIIKSAYHRFPSGTIHFIGLSGQGSPSQSAFHKDYLVVKARGYFFVGIDSGIFSLLLDDHFDAIYRLPIESTQDREMIWKGIIHALSYLLKGDRADNIGTPQNTLTQSFLPRPTVDPDSLRGSVLYVDSFGNAIVNVSRELFDEGRRGRRFTIFLRKSNYDIQRISRAYEDAEVGEIVALFNRENLLEIALNRDSAARLLGIKLMDPIRIDFYDH